MIFQWGTTMIRLLTGLAAAASVAFSVASAQFAMGSAQPQERISVAEVAEVMAGFEITTSQITAPNGTLVLRAVTPGGGVFFMQPRGCTVPATGQGCQLVEFLAILPGATTPFERINAFHSEISFVSTVIKNTDGTMAVSAKSLFTGGLTKPHLKFRLAAFLQDMQNFTSRYMGSQTSNALGVRVSTDFPMLITEDHVSDSNPYRGLIEMSAEAADRYPASIRPTWTTPELEAIILTKMDELR